MKVILTGESTPEHFYPLIAIGEELVDLIDEKNLADIGVYLFSDKKYDKKIIYENGISFRTVVVGKSKFSLKTLIGCLQTLILVFSIFPDVIVSKGGMTSYPVLFAARLLKIPVIIHESNSIPNEISIWSSKKAHKVAIAYAQAIEKIDRDDVIHVGQPILKNLKSPSMEGAHEFLNLEETTPILWIANSDRDSDTMNVITEESLPSLLYKYQVVHQVGDEYFKEFKKITDAMLMDHPFKYRYHSFPSLNSLSVKMLAGVADLAVIRPDVRLFNIAHWGIPSIVIPNKKNNDLNQLRNAYNYARAGACVVIEENNLNDQSFIFEINRIYDNQEIHQEMSKSAKEFAIPDAGKNIAEEIVGIVLAHEK